MEKKILLPPSLPISLFQSLGHGDFSVNFDLPKDYTMFCDMEPHNMRLQELNFSRKVEIWNIWTTLSDKKKSTYKNGPVTTDPKSAVEGFCRVCDK